MRALRVCLVGVSLAGCVSQIRRVPSKWDHASDPKCTEDYGLAVADGMFGAVVTGTALVVADQLKDRNTARGIAVGGFVVGVVFGISAAIGVDEVNDCRVATEAWRVAQATLKQTRTPRAGDWFCAADGSCARDRAACEQQGGPCAAVGVVWCFAKTDDSERCLATPDACWPELRRAGGDAVGGCERR